MQTEQSQVIVRRFFEAVRRLKEEKVIRGVNTFTARYGINRRNFLTCERQPQRDIFQVAWLGFLVSDYKISPSWLLVGKGDFYQRGWDAEKVRKQQKDRKCGKSELKHIENNTVAK